MAVDQSEEVGTKKDESSTNLDTSLQKQPSIKKRKNSKKSQAKMPVKEGKKILQESDKYC